MNFSKAFTYIFDDKDWLTKLILPVLCSLIPFIGPFVLSGYITRLIHNVETGQALPLPQMDFAEDLAKGFKWFVIGLVYVIPAILLCFFMAAVFSLAADENSVIAVLFGLLAAGALMVYIIFLLFFLPVVQAQFAMGQTIKSGFQITKAFRMLVNNFSAWLQVAAGGLIAALISPIGGILLVIGTVISSTYSSLMVSHLTGQAYAVSTRLDPVIGGTVANTPQPPYSQPYQAPGPQRQAYPPTDAHQPFGSVPEKPAEPGEVVQKDQPESPSGE